MMQLRILPRKNTSGYANALNNITVRQERSALKTRLIHGLFSIISFDDLNEAPPLTSFYNMSFISSIASSKKYPTVKAIASHVKKESKKRAKRPEGIGKRPVEVLLSIMRGFGLIEIIPSGVTYRVALTRLGSLVREAIKKNNILGKQLSNADKVSLILLPGLLFPSKARLLYLATKTPGFLNINDYYNLIRAKLLRGELHGYERLAWEILEEVILTRTGHTRNYFSQVELLLNVLNSIDRYPGFDTFMFATGKVKLKPEYQPLGFTDLLRKEPPEELPEVIPKKARVIFSNLIEELAKRKEEIESQQIALYELPTRI